MISLENTFIITEIHKSTKAKFWEDREVGHVVVISYPIKDPGRNEGLYATRINLRCGDDTARTTPTYLAKILKHIELEKIR